MNEGARQANQERRDYAERLHHERVEQLLTDILATLKQAERERCAAVSEKTKGTGRAIAAAIRGQE